MSEIQKLTVEAYLRNGGNVRATARELGRDPKTVREHLANAGIEKPIAAGEVKYSAPKRLPNKKGGRVFLLTCAQNNTKVHDAFWTSLLALRDHRSAELHVAQLTYNHHAYEKVEDGALWYDPKIAKYACENNIEIAPGLVWNGEVNILPTAVNPLSGFDTFNGSKSGIFPHTKIAMQSVANAKHEPTKFNYTTGTATLRNYVAMKAGQKASFHHAYGALIVEVSPKGEWFARQINASEDGSFQDLDVFVSEGKVQTGQTVEACIWGDIHTAQIEPNIEKAVWDEGGILDQLGPKYQVMHDLLDFRARNHHDVNNCHLEFQKHLEGADDVAWEIRKTAEFLGRAWREGVETVVIPSNHDDALTRWLREADYKDDPKNALFFLRTQTAVYEALESGDEDFHVLKWALESRVCQESWSLEGAALFEGKFLHVDDSYVVKGVELGNHGHLGTNGSRGSPKQFAKTGMRSVTGHTHTCGIVDGCTTVGTFSILDPAYCKGPSSWSHTFCVMYPSGKRALVTIKSGKYRA